MEPKVGTMMSTPEDDEIEYLELELQEKEGLRDGVTLNGKHYKELTVEIDKLTADIARRRAAQGAPA